MIKPLIKAGHLENLTDARYFAAKDVEWLGFDLDENDPDSISIQELNAIKEWVEGPKIIAEVGFLNLGSNNLLAQLSGLDGIQISGFTEFDRTLLPENQIVIREIVVQKNGEVPTDPSQFPHDEIILFDLEKNQITPEALQMQYDNYLIWLQAIVANRKEYILDLPLAGNQLHSFVQDFQPWAIQLKGSEEEKVGFKSFDMIDAYFDYYDEWA